MLAVHELGVILLNIISVGSWSVRSNYDLYMALTFIRLSLLLSGLLLSRLLANQVASPSNSCDWRCIVANTRSI